MIFKDLLDSVNKEKRRRERAKVAKKVAVGMGIVATIGVATGILIAPKSGKETRKDMKNKVVNTVETIKDTVQKNVETVKDSAANAAQEVRNVIKDVHGRTEGVKNDIQDSGDEIQQNIHKIAKNISNELEK